jgi:hypothetical protein
MEKLCFLGRTFLTIIERMFTPKYYYIPLRLGTQTDFQPVIPDELVHHFDVAERVGRYVYTEEEVNFMFLDNVAVHTKRLVNYLRNLDVPDFLDRNTIERMLWLHDLPEAVVNEERGSDYEKIADVAFEEFQDSREDGAAKLMFSPEDLRLYQEVEQSKWIIKNVNWSDINTYKNGIFAKMLDWFDGRNTFTYVTTEWIAHEDYEKTRLLPPLDTFSLSLEQSYQVWMKNFSTIPDPVFRDFMRDFIHREIYDFHRLRWDPVIEKTSPEVQAMYQEFMTSGV